MYINLPYIQFAADKETMMKYNSTRDKSKKFDSAYAIKTGIAADGGLYVPDTVPTVTADFIDSLKNLSYKERAAKILGLFLTDYTAEELADCANGAYANEKFSSEKIAPVHRLDNRYVLELWHGPTCAFKDMALQILPHFLTKAIKKTGEDKKVIILVATSGDTGKAALEGFRDVEGTGIMVFYPNHGVSKIQQLQMATQEGANVSVVAVNGNFDDAQTGVKKIFTNEEYKEKLAKHGLMFSSANSINWGRLAPQIVYYFSAYCDMLASGDIKLGDKINITVPTGNFGNILAAYYAKIMGLPVNKLICASNSNNVLTEFIRTGVYDRNRKFYTTISPSMDILISSNLERLLYQISGGDDKLVAQYMKELSDTGRYEVNDEIKEQINALFYADCCDDAETKAAIARTNKDFGYTPDTHTAVALDVYDKYRAATGDDTKTVIASTANPFKFNESVIKAIAGEDSCDGLDEFELLDKLSQISGMAIPSSLAQLKTKKVRFDTVCDKEDMIKETDKFMNI